MVQGNKLKMSSFDGVHAYYFEGILTDNKRIQGDFYSGSTYHVTWEGTKDDAIELRSPYQISHAIEPNETLRISVKKQNGRKKTLSATYFRGQPTVVQIIGTWCPNCLDETNYFKSLLEKPEFSNIRWVSIAFENGETDAERIKRIQAYVRKSKLKHAFYLGGGASSKAASTVFHQLNGVFSFPTTFSNSLDWCTSTSNLAMRVKASRLCFRSPAWSWLSFRSRSKNLLSSASPPGLWHCRQVRSPTLAQTSF
jgi:thiol-disulfide isomerase/thioredoxin